MIDLRTASRLNRVTAVFQDATVLAFDLSREMSLGALAVQIGELAGRHGGLFLPVRVQLAPPARSRERAGAARRRRRATPASSARGKRRLHPDRRAAA